MVIVRLSKIRAQARARWPFLQDLLISYKKKKRKPPSNKAERAGNN
jgi:transposase